MKGPYLQTKFICDGCDYYRIIKGRDRQCMI